MLAADSLLPFGLLVLASAAKDGPPVPLLDLRPEAARHPLTPSAPSLIHPVAMRQVIDGDDLDPAMTIAVVQHLVGPDAAPARSLVAQFDLDRPEPVTYGFVLPFVHDRQRPLATDARRVLAQIVGRSSALAAATLRQRNPEVLHDFLADPTLWLASSHARPAPVPWTRERLHDALCWSRVGIRHEWMATRWRKRGVRDAEMLAEWRTVGLGFFTDADAARIGPYARPAAAARFPSLPPSQMMRWYRAGVLSEDSAMRADERGWDPRDLSALTHQMRRSLHAKEPEVKDLLIDLLDGAGPFDPREAIVAFRAGLDVPAVIDLINRGRLSAEQGSLRVMAGLLSNA